MSPAGSVTIPTAGHRHNDQQPRRGGVPPARPQSDQDAVGAVDGCINMADYNTMLAH